MSTHRVCNHPATAAARRKCRADQAKAASETVTVRTDLPELLQSNTTVANRITKKMPADFKFNGKTASEWREMAKASDQESADSFDRCDTDGFLSQWANTELARHYRYLATITERGGRVEYPALFDLDGNHIPAKEIDSKYGIRYFVFDPAGINGERYVSISLASNEATARKNNAKKGFYFGTASYKATVSKSSTKVWVDDDDYQNDVVIIDNGQ